MNPTRVLGALLVVVGIAWFLAVPAVLPAAFHGYVHTGHGHAQFAANSIDPTGQSPDAVLRASQHAEATADAEHAAAVSIEALSERNRSTVREARSTGVNATATESRARLRRLADSHPYVHTGDGWLALELEDESRYTVLTATVTDTATVVSAVAVPPSRLADPSAAQTRAIVEADGVVLVSDPHLPKPLYLRVDGTVMQVVRVGDAPSPPSPTALALFLVPGVVFALVGSYLAARS